MAQAIPSLGVPSPKWHRRETEGFAPRWIWPWPSAEMKKDAALWSPVAKGAFKGELKGKCALMIGQTFLSCFVST